MYTWAARLTARPKNPEPGRVGIALRAGLEPDF
jgi:hypothetical protein